MPSGLAEAGNTHLDSLGNNLIFEERKDDSALAHVLYDT